MTGAPGVVTVLLADRQPMFSDALAVALGLADGIIVVAATDNAQTALDLAGTCRPRVVLVDSDLADQSGAWLAARLADTPDPPRVVMLTAHHEDRVLAAALAAGCAGFVTKNRPVAVLVDAVRAAAQGRNIVSARELTRLLATLRADYTSFGSDLTAREVEVLQLLAEGRNTRAVADTLYLSHNTVRNYVQSILTKLDAHTQLEAVSGALREGIVNLDTPTT